MARHFSLELLPIDVVVFLHVGKFICSIPSVITLEIDDDAIKFPPFIFLKF
jgi:hypothetical protein